MAKRKSNSLKALVRSEQGQGVGRLQDRQALRAKVGHGKRPYPACRPTMAQCKKSVAKRKTGYGRVNWKGRK